MVQVLKAYLIIKKTGEPPRRYRCRSFLLNFVKWFRHKFTISSASEWGTGYKMVAENGTEYTFPFVSNTNELAYGGMRGEEGQAGRGIVVGSGDTPVSKDDYKLASKIPHGDGDGQLHYGVTSVLDIVTSDSEMKFRVVRSFTNNGSTDITVTETGIMMCITNNKGGSNNILIIRDVLPSPVTVAPGETLTVKYEFTFSI